MGEIPKGTFVPPVELDRLWKDSIHRTMTNQLFIWPAKWSYLVEEYRKMNEALEGKRALSPYDGSKVMTRPDSQSKGKEKVYLPPIHGKSIKVNNQFPKTSNGWYGHMHLKDGHNLVWERQQWTKTNAGQHDLIKLFKWPMDYYD